MSRVALLGGTYLARSIIASAQVCENLYPEKNPQDAGAPTTHYLTPGLTQQLVPPVAGPARGFYVSTTGLVFYVCGNSLLIISTLFVATTLGALNDNLSTPVSMVDNGNVVVVVNGQPGVGWAVDLTTLAFAQITDPAFLGATRVDYVDTFFVLNQPATKNFYCSLSNVTFAQLTGTVGQPIAGSVLAAGTGGTPGTYPGTVMTGGIGAGFTADVVVGAGGGVTSVVPNADGAGYIIGDVLSATLPGPLSGFSWSVSSVHGHAFDPTNVAAKTGFADVIATLCVVHREIWLFGIVKTTEVWYDSGGGGGTFPFAIMPGVFVEHGCVAPYSVTKHDLLVFWLSIDAEGQGTVYMGAGYRATKISTPAIATAISGYATLSDAVGMMYKQQDHIFYVLTFPTADVTWVYDLSEGLWHQRTWTDPNTGLQHRWRPACLALANGRVLAGDYLNGNVYTVDLGSALDFGGPIVRRRSFPHLVRDLKRVTYDQFIADMECGNGILGSPAQQPQLLLEMSTDRGRTYRALPMQSLGEQGNYNVQPMWRQLGLARDAVFRLSWSDNVLTALNGAYVDVTPTVSPRT